MSGVGLSKGTYFPVSNKSILDRRQRDFEVNFVRHTPAEWLNFASGNSYLAALRSGRFSSGCTSIARCISFGIGNTYAPWSDSGIFYAQVLLSETIVVRHLNSMTYAQPPPSFVQPSYHDTWFDISADQPATA
jgi:hypothetical protein